MSFDPSTVKLGKLAPKVDPRTLRLENYITKPIPIPSALNWYHGPEARNGFQWQMFLNDSLGDCAVAGPAHLEMLWTFNVNDAPFTPTDPQVLTDYSQISGYVPGNPGTDAGCVLLKVLNTWTNTGLFGRKLKAYVQINPKNLEHIKTAIYLFGGLDVGIGIPKSAVPQVGQTWTITDPKLQGDAAPGSWGGHCVIIGSYDDEKQEFSCITWGQEQKMTYAWFQAYCDEAFAPLSPDWLNARGVNPLGFDFATLDADLANVRY